MTTLETRPLVAGLEKKQRRRTRIGLVAGGLGAYWPQFPGLLPQLQESARYVTERFQAMDADVVDVGSSPTRRSPPPPLRSSDRPTRT